MLYGFRKLILLVVRGLAFLVYCSLPSFIPRNRAQQHSVFCKRTDWSSNSFPLFLVFLCCHVCLICLCFVLFKGPQDETADWCLGKLGWMGQVQSELWWWSQLSATALLFPKVKDNFLYWAPAYMVQHTFRTKIALCLVPEEKSHLRPLYMILNFSHITALLKTLFDMSLLCLLC